MARKSAPRYWLALVLMLLLLMAAARTACAHAVLVRSTPAAHAVVAARSTDSRLEFSLEFNSRIDAPRSLLVLAGPSGAPRKLPAPVQAAPNRLSAAAYGLTPGSYLLRWQVLSTDGHMTRGEIPFEVK